MINKKTLNRWGRSGVALLLAGTILCVSSMEVSAVRTVGEIEEEQSSIQEELNGLDADLVGIVSAMTELEEQIAIKTEEIAQTEAMLIEAQAAVDQQYDSMKLRIQFMYENSDENIMTILLESGSISDFLNRLENISAVYSYDRTVLSNYEAAKNEVAALKTSLEEEKVSLQANEAELQQQQSQLNAMIAEKKGEMEDIQSELAEAKALARRQAALEQARLEAALSGGGSSGSGSSNSGGGSGGSGGSSGATMNPPQTTGVSGSAVVAYANQYVGYPYVWGGTDPNTGADCSGFIYYVLKHFGINYGRLTSYGWRSVGQEVSIDSIQPGDIVCYAGHVAIYAGGGRIVEAQSSAAGITNNRSVNCSRIITIRRVL